MADETIQRIYQLIIDAGGSKAGADVFKQAAEQIGAASRTAANSQQQVAQTTAQVQAQYDRLVSRIDPAVRAQQQFAVGASRVQAAFQAQIIPLEEVEQRLEQLTQRVNGGVGAARNWGNAVQNAGFQVGDFAVQIASGQNPLRAFIQQGTQLISMFGPWGAVIGAGGAVIGALATSFLGLEDATKKATEAEDAHSKALERAHELYKGIRGEVEQTTQARTAELRAIVQQAQEENDAAQAKLAATPQFSSPIQTTAGGKTIGATPNPKFAQAQAAAAAANDYYLKQLGILDAALDDYDARIQKSFSVKPEDTKQTGDQTSAVKAQTSAVDDLVRAMESQIQLSQESARQKSIDEAVIRAEAAAQKDYDADLRDSPLLDPDTVARIQKMAGATYDAANAHMQVATAAKHAATATADLNSTLNGLLYTTGLMAPNEAQIELAYEKGTMGFEEYSKAIAAIDDAQLGMADSHPDRTVRAVASASDAAAQSTNQWRSTVAELGSTFTSAFDDAVISGAKLSDVLRGLGQDVERLILRAGENKLLDKLFGSGGAGGSSSGGWLDDAWSWITTSDGNAGNDYGTGWGGNRASGGPVSAGTLYRVNENGEEFFRPNVDGSVIPMGSESSGGRGGPTYHFTPVAQFNVTGSIDRSTEFAMHRVAATYANAAVSGFKQSINTGGSDAKLVGRRQK